MQGDGDECGSSHDIQPAAGNGEPSSVGGQPLSGPVPGKGHDRADTRQNGGDTQKHGHGKGQSRFWNTPRDREHHDEQRERARDEARDEARKVSFAVEVGPRPPGPHHQPDADHDQAIAADVLDGRCPTRTYQRSSDEPIGDDSQQDRTCDVGCRKDDGRAHGTERALARSQHIGRKNGFAVTGRHGMGSTEYDTERQHGEEHAPVVRSGEAVDCSGQRTTNCLLNLIEQLEHQWPWLWR